jgi:putative membrane protein
VTFAGIGLLSVPPTIEFIRWRRAGVAPDDAGIGKVRRYVHVQLALFVLLLIFAAAMARGYGEF